MFGYQRLVIGLLLVIGGASTFLATERLRRPAVHRESTDSAHAQVRAAELRRRAERPVPRKTEVLRVGHDYDVIVNESVPDDHVARLLVTNSLPPTKCRSVEPVPSCQSEEEPSPPALVHERTQHMFESQSGFGFMRMLVTENERGIQVASRAIDRVELVSLLTEAEPSVYVLDEMVTPALARHARRRPLDEFESLGLDAVRSGQELVWTREAPDRMFGAIRAQDYCLECHRQARVGDLLGAFSYYLLIPVDQLNEENSRR